MRGDVLLKKTRHEKWIRLFRWFCGSDKAVLLIHCKDRNQGRYVMNSAEKFGWRVNRPIWCHAVGKDLYLIKKEPLTETTVEVNETEDGMHCYFYDWSTK